MANAGISGSEVEDMMLEAGETRFGDQWATQPVDMLSDNGLLHTVKDTRIFVRSASSSVCFTPVKSPQSNGISEAFVRTLKRDYVQVTPLPNADVVLGLLPSWFED